MHRRDLQFQCVLYVNMHDDDDNEDEIPFKFEYNFGFVIPTSTEIIYPDACIQCEASSHACTMHEFRLNVPQQHRSGFRLKHTIVVQIKWQPLEVEPPSSPFDLLLQDYEKLADEEMLHDCRVVCRDGREVQSNKFILATRCPALLTRMQSNSPDNEIHIDDADYDAVRIMIRFFYGNKINDFDNAVAVQLLKLAHKVCKLFHARE